jgi:hypothetical protein
VALRLLSRDTHELNAQRQLLERIVRLVRTIRRLQEGMIDHRELEEIDRELAELERQVAKATDETMARCYEQFNERKGANAGPRLRQRTP